MGSSFPYSNYKQITDLSSELPVRPEPIAKKKKTSIPYSSKTQKSRRIQQELKIVETIKKKRKITKKEIKQMIDRNVQWKKNREAKLYHQKVELEMQAKQQCTFNPIINSLSHTLSQKSNGRLSSDLQSPRTTDLAELLGIKQSVKAIKQNRKDRKHIRSKD